MRSGWFQDQHKDYKRYALVENIKHRAPDEIGFLHCTKYLRVV